MDRRCVVTGFGCLTGAGLSAEHTWGAVVDGRTGIDRMSNPATREWPYRLAAEITGYDARELVPDRKLLKAITRPDVLGLNAVTQALEHGGLLEHRQRLSDPAAFNERTGIFVGAPASEYLQRYDFLPALAAAGEGGSGFGARAMDSVHPLWLLRTLPNNVLAYTAIHYGFKGSNHNFTGHGVGGSQAIAEARHQLREGSIDRAVVVAFDSPAEPEAVARYGGAGLLSPSGLRPFDRTRDGTVLGEGAGALILETVDAACARGAAIYGEVSGSGMGTEARGVLGIREDGAGLCGAMRNALRDAGLRPDDVGMITTHGNGTPASDASEARALETVFEERAAPATAFKWSVGHTLAASGVVESILTLLALRDGTAPPLPTLREWDHECRGADVSADARVPRAPCALVLTRGFGGLNSCLVLSEFKR